MPRSSFLQQRRETMAARREAAERNRQEAETASTTAEGSETVIGTDEVEMNSVPMTPRAFGPRTPSPVRDDTVPEAGADTQMPEPELPKTPKKEDDEMEVDSEKMPVLEETSGSESVDPERDIFDRDDLYASDDSDSEDELSDQFRMGHCMDQLLSDDYVPDEGVDRDEASKLQRQLIDFWTDMHRAYLATGKPKFKLPQRVYKKLQAVQRKSYKHLVPENVSVFIGVQHFDDEDLNWIPQNRNAWEWNFRKGNYIRQIRGETF